MVTVSDAVDLDNPPTEPPAGSDSAMWRVARKQYERHRPTDQGECQTCPRWRSCFGRAVARDGLATALGQTVRESAYWKAYAGTRFAESWRVA